MASRPETEWSKLDFMTQLAIIKTMTDTHSFIGTTTRLALRADEILLFIQTYLSVKRHDDAFPRDLKAGSKEEFLDEPEDLFEFSEFVHIDEDEPKYPPPPDNYPSAQQSESQQADNQQAAGRGPCDHEDLHLKVPECDSEALLHASECSALTQSERTTAEQIMAHIDLQRVYGWLCNIINNLVYHDGNAPRTITKLVDILVETIQVRTVNANETLDKYFVHALAVALYFKLLGVRAQQKIGDIFIRDLVRRVVRELEGPREVLSPPYKNIERGRTFLQSLGLGHFADKLNEDEAYNGEIPTLCVNWEVYEMTSVPAVLVNVQTQEEELKIDPRLLHLQPSDGFGDVPGHVFSNPDSHPPSAGVIPDATSVPSNMVDITEDTLASYEMQEQYLQPQATSSPTSVVHSSLSPQEIQPHPTSTAPVDFQPYPSTQEIQPHSTTTAPACFQHHLSSEQPQAQATMAVPPADESSIVAHQIQSEATISAPAAVQPPASAHPTQPQAISAHVPQHQPEISAPPASSQLSVHHRQRQAMVSTQQPQPDAAMSPPTVVPSGVSANVIAHQRHQQTMTNAYQPQRQAATSAPDPATLSLSARVALVKNHIQNNLKSQPAVFRALFPQDHPGAVPPSRGTRQQAVHIKKSLKLGAKFGIDDRLLAALFPVEIPPIGTKQPQDQAPSSASNSSVASMSPTASMSPAPQRQTTASGFTTLPNAGTAQPSSATWDSFGPLPLKSEVAPFGTRYSRPTLQHAYPSATAMANAQSHVAARLQAPFTTGYAPAPIYETAVARTPASTTYARPTSSNRPADTGNFARPLAPHAALPPLAPAPGVHSKYSQNYAAASQVKPHSDVQQAHAAPSAGPGVQESVGPSQGFASAQVTESDTGGSASEWDAHPADGPQDDEDEDPSYDPLAPHGRKRSGGHGNNSPAKRIRGRPRKSD